MTALCPKCRRALECAACAEAGMTKAETARHFGVSRSTVTQVAQRHGIVFRSAREAPK